MQKVIRSQYRSPMNDLFKYNTNKINDALDKNNFEQIPGINALLLEKTTQILLSGAKARYPILKKWYAEREKNSSDENKTTSNERYEEFDAILEKIKKRSQKKNLALQNFLAKNEWVFLYLQGIKIKDRHENATFYSLSEERALELLSNLLKNTRHLSARFMQALSQHPAIKKHMEATKDQEAFALFRTILANQIPSLSKTFLTRNIFIQDLIKNEEKLNPFTQKNKTDSSL